MQASTQVGAGNTFLGKELQVRTFTRRDPSRGLRVLALKDIQGRVVSVNMNKTAVVQVDKFVPHPLYGKRVRTTKKFFAHDEEEQCGVGDTVEIISIPPLSKKKSFKVSRIVAKSDI